MIAYLVQGAVLCVPTCLCLYLLRSARAWQRLAVCTTALVLAVIPWQLFDSLWLWSTPINLDLLQPLEHRVLGTSNSNLIMPANPSSGPTLLLLATLSGLAGFAFFNWQHFRYVRQLRRSAAVQYAESKHHGITVLATPEPNVAFASGWRRREIWVSEAVLAHPQKHIALTHEAIRHQLHHPAIQWLLTLLTCLCWWHPLVHGLTRQMRRDLELQCDEHCVTRFGVSNYRQGLAELLLDTRQANLRLAWNTRSPSEIGRAHV